MSKKTNPQGMKNGKMKFAYDIGEAPCRACGYGDVLDDIDDAPSIVPADESDMDSFIHIFEEDDEEDGMDSFIRILKD